MDFKDFFFLPELASAHGHRIDFLIYLIHILMIVLFVGWGIYFIVVLVRFNRRRNARADYHGIHSKTATSIEVMVALVEIILLVGISIPFWSKYVDALPQRPTVEVRVVAEQFAWNIHYPGEDGIFGKTDVKFFNKESNPLGIDPNDPNAQDDITTINQLHLPVGKPAQIHLSSKDVVHSFALQEMRVKQDAIPGMSIPVNFVPTKTGNYEIACAQLCGLGHYRMQGFMTIQSPEDFGQWLSEQTKFGSAGEEGSYDDFWN